MIDLVRAIFLILVLGLGLPGCVASEGYQSPATGNVEGIVRDEAGVAIPGAMVVIEDAGLSATTAADGYYLFEDIPAGTYSIAASAHEYYPESALVTIEGGKTTTQDITLQAIRIYSVSHVLSGAVKDSATGEPLWGVTVTIEGTSLSAITGDDGSYSISDVEAGVYNVTASKSGYASQTRTVTVESDSIADFELIALVRYDLTISSSAGVSVTVPGEGKFAYDAGTVVELVATPDDGYRFVEWAGDVDTVADVNAAATNITMSGNYSVTARAVPVYCLTISCTEGGSITLPGEGIFAYDAGTVVELVATPDDGYRFVEWTGDVGTVADVNALATNVTMSGNYSIMANFVVQATQVKVESVTYAVRGGRDGQKHLDVTVLLLDNLGEPVADASVSATLYRDDGKTWHFQGTTNLNGTVTFNVNNHANGCYWLEVTAVAAEGLEWDGVTPQNGYCKG